MVKTVTTIIHSPVAVIEGKICIALEFLVHPMICSLILFIVDFFWFQTQNFPNPQIVEQICQHKDLSANYIEVTQVKALMSESCQKQQPTLSPLAHRQSLQQTSKEIHCGTYLAACWVFCQSPLIHFHSEDSTTSPFTNNHRICFNSIRFKYNIQWQVSVYLLSQHLLAYASTSSTHSSCTVFNSNSYPVVLMNNSCTACITNSASDLCDVSSNTRSSISGIGGPLASITLQSRLKWTFQATIAGSTFPVHTSHFMHPIGLSHHKI